MNQYHALLFQRKKTTNMKEFWNKRFSAGEYAYGTEPNLFFLEQAEKLKPGKILFPAEGEGRNAVYAARLGWEVDAFDISTEAKQKAEKLAENNNVKIRFLVADFEDINYPKAYFDCLVLIYAHFKPEFRNRYHRSLLELLKPGGVILLEGFSKKQINMNSGGPKDIHMLFSRAELEKDFNSLSTIHITETEYILDEGKYHQGLAAVIRLTGIQ
jgi:SAM-dependent methyltransferase